MRTAAAWLIRLNEHLEITEDPEPHPVGRLHVDSAVRYLLRVPCCETDAGFPEVPPNDLEEVPNTGAPGLRLEGRDGMWIELRRPGPGRTFRLSMKDGESNHPIEEMQAVSRIRLFIEAWGEETDLTSEIRLSPEQRRKIADLERSRDEERRRRVAEGNHVVFRKRVYQLPCVLFVLGTAALAALVYFILGPEGVASAAAAALLALGSLGGLWLLFKTYRVEVDLAAGVVRVVAFDGATYVGELGEFQHADVRALPEKKEALGVFVMTHDGERVRVGRRTWPTRDAEAIADAINDALDVAEADRKFLSYRRHPGRARK